MDKGELTDFYEYVEQHVLYSIIVLRYSQADSTNSQTKTLEIMPNTLLTFIVSVSFSLMFHLGLTQCTVTLSDKFVICDYEDLPLPLASGLVVSGGTEPYSFYWDCFWQLYPGSSITMDEYDILDDPTSIHPTIINSAQGDTIHLHLSITDAELNTCEASILVITACFPTTLLGICEWATINPGESVALCTEVYTCIEPTSYSWTPSNSLDDPNIRFPIASPTENTLYTLTLTDPVGCSATSEMQVFLVTTGISEEYKSEFKVIQHSTDDNLELVFPYYGNWNIVVYNINGTIVKTGKADHPTQYTINLSSLHSGIYMVICKDPNGRIFKHKIMLQ
ncbi:MAG TPA: T9SS type A sorting domain-containing protein [Flavobacteriales bacterium]